MTSHRTLLAASVILAMCLPMAPSHADDPPPKPAPPQEPPKPAPAPPATDEKPPVGPAADAAAEAASDAAARAILAKAAALQNAGDLAEPGKLESFHVVFNKAYLEKTTTKADGSSSTTLMETDTDGLVFDWMKGSVKTQVTLDGQTTTKAWYEPMHLAWISDGTTSSNLAGAKSKSDYDQLQFHRTVVNELLDVAILGKLLTDKSRWRVVTDPASPEKTVAIERIPPADAKGAVAIKLWIANPSPGVYGDVVAASMPPTAENAATVFYDFKYRDEFPAVRAKDTEGKLADVKLRFPHDVTVYEQRAGEAERTKVLEVFTRSVDINTVLDTDFKQPKKK